MCCFKTVAIQVRMYNALPVGSTQADWSHVVVDTVQGDQVQIQPTCSRAATGQLCTRHMVEASEIWVKLRSDQLAAAIQHNALAV